MSAKAWGFVSTLVLVTFAVSLGSRRSAPAFAGDGGGDPVPSGNRQLVTGAPQHLQRVADNQPEGTAWVGIKPIDPYNGSSYPPGVTRSGDTINLALRRTGFPQRGLINHPTGKRDIVLFHRCPSARVMR